VARKVAQRGERKAFISNSKECKNNSWWAQGRGNCNDKVKAGALKKSLKIIRKHETGMCEW